MLFALVWVHSTVFAQGLKAPVEGPNALGRFGGKIAWIDDASAVSINPANITEMAEPTYYEAITVMYFERTFAPPGESEIKSQEPWAFLPYAYGTIPLGDSGRWFFGVGLSGAFGLGAEWERNSPLKYAAPYSTQTAVLNFNPNLAVKLTDSVSIAVGFDVFWAESESKQDYFWGGGNPDGVLEMEGTGLAYGGNAALTWRITERQRIALTYRSGADQKIKGSARISNIPGTAPPEVTPRSNFSTTYYLPDLVGIGYGIHFFDCLKVGFDAEWGRHSRMKTLRIDLDNNNALLPATELPQNWMDTWLLGVGAEWSFARNWKLRCGGLWGGDVVPMETVMPETAQRDSIMLSLGLGWQRGSHSLDTALVYNIIEDFTVNNNQIPAYNGTYDGMISMFSLGYQYRF